MPKNRLARLFDDATLYPIQLVGNEHVDFVPMTYAAYHRSTFLDRRIRPAEPNVFRASIAEVAAARPDPGQVPDLRFIVHSAYCCSSLLATALSRLPNTLVLREPLTLLQVALGIADRAHLPLIEALLARRNAPGDAVVVKATSACSVMAADLLRDLPGARAIALYAPLPSFLLAILRDPQRVRRMRDTLANGEPTAADAARVGAWWPDDGARTAIADLDDLKLAAWIWIGRVRALARLEEATPQRVTFLDGDTLPLQPAAVLQAAATALNLPVAPDAIEPIARDTLWRLHAKEPTMAFDPKAREKEHADLTRRHRPALAAAIEWARQLMDRGTDGTMRTAWQLSGLGD